MNAEEELHEQALKAARRIKSAFEADKILVAAGKPDLVPKLFWPADIMKEKGIELDAVKADIVRHLMFANAQRAIEALRAEGVIGENHIRQGVGDWQQYKKDAAEAERVFKMMGGGGKKHGKKRPP